MDNLIATLVDGVLVTVIDHIVVPITGTIPFLASSGILLVVFAGLWAVFALALARSQPSLDAAWARIRGLPMIMRGAAWLLFLPVVAGLWVWRTSWPMAARLTVIGGLAGWNLLVFLPGPA